MKNLIINIVTLLIVNLSYAQNIGINETGSIPDASAILDISSTTKGILIPRMTTLQRTEISTSAIGLLVFDTDTQSFWFKNSSEWINLNSNNNGWSFAGNNVGNNDFIGTTNNQSLVFKANNQIAGKIDILKNNTFWGYESGKSNTDGFSNVGNGVGTLFSNTTGFNNTAIGHGALHNNTSGYWNTANGMVALFNNTTGYQNSSTGAFSLYLNTTGHENTANGYDVLRNNTTGEGNTANGSYALSTNTNGSFNAANGSFALRQNTVGGANTANGYNALFSNSIGNNNTSNGANSLYSNTSGFGNLANGLSSLGSNVTGFYNTADGISSGYTNVSGSRNTFLGAHADVSADGISNATAIGANAIVNSSNKVRIGNSAVTVIEGQVAWSTPSDRRLKENIRENNRLGLNFITKLKPVTYNYISDKTKVRHDGFIAQDVARVLNYLQIPFSGIKKSSDGLYSLAYSDFIMPMVNAIKEQQTQIINLNKENKEFEDRITALENLNLENGKNLGTKK